MNPLVSVLMPVYNAKSDEFRQAIESILNQTYTDFEFLIVNDGSTNDTEDVVLSYDDSRIRYVKNEKNEKIVASLNKGLSLCRGKYVARLDADDYSTLTRLEKQVEYMENYPNIGLLGTYYKRVYSGNEINKPTNLTEPTEPLDVKLFSRYIRGCIQHSSAMIRRSVLVENNLKYNRNCIHAEDIKLWSDMSYHCDLAVLPEVLSFYRTSEDGISRSNFEWQNKMCNVIILDNMIRDFARDKNRMYSILVKYVKAECFTEDEFGDLIKLLDMVSHEVSAKVSPLYKKFVWEFNLARIQGIRVSGNNTNT